MATSRRAWLHEGGLQVVLLLLLLFVLLPMVALLILEAGSQAAHGEGWRCGTAHRVILVLAEHIDLLVVMVVLTWSPRGGAGLPFTEFLQERSRIVGCLCGGTGGNFMNISYN